jgi:hypothetical protein
LFCCMNSSTFLLLYHRKIFFWHSESSSANQLYDAQRTSVESCSRTPLKLISANSQIIVTAAHVDSSKNDRTAGTGPPSPRHLSFSFCRWRRMWAMSIKTYARSDGRNDLHLCTMTHCRPLAMHFSSVFNATTSFGFSSTVALNYSATSAVCRHSHFIVTGNLGEPSC